LRRRLADLLAIPERQLIDLAAACFWLALHDVGQLSAPFCAQVEGLWLPEMGDRSDVPKRTTTWRSGLPVMG